MAVEIGVGHLETVDKESGTYSIGSESNRLLLHTREIHGTVLLQVSYLSGQTVAQLILDLIGRSFRVMPVVHAFLLHKIGHGLDVGQEFVDNAVDTFYFKYTASH